VLIVDDEPSIRFLLRLAFETAGHTVVEAPDGKRALAEVEASPPDLVTTDFMMPVLDGAGLIARLREEPGTAAIPILLISSSPGAGNVQGADDFMQKPLDPAEAVTRAEALLRSDA
jgi:DNA-binding response OmpR family regulator